MKALSIRQPWAWLIVNGHKDIENRSRNIGGHLGPVLIHASQVMTRADWFACSIFVGGIMDQLPPGFPGLPLPEDLKKECGGIVGRAFVRGHGNLNYSSPWYTGDYAYQLEQAKPLPFIACKGRLGFFNVELL